MINLNKQIIVWLFVALLFLTTACQKNESSKQNTEDSFSEESINSVIESSEAISTMEAAVDIKEAPIQSYLEQFSDKNIGIYIKEISTGTVYSVNEDVIFYGASIAKLPIILYTQKQLLTGQINEETHLIYRDEVNNVPGAMIRGGTGIMQNKIDQQQEFTIQELLEWTIVHSDNLASNMLSYYVAEQNGVDFLNSINPYYSFNQTEFTKDMTAATAGELMSAIYQNNLAVDFFAETDWAKEKIGSLEQKTYHKIGTNEEFNHDVGVVSGDTPYVLSILSEDYSNEAIETIVKDIDSLLEGGKNK